MWLKVRYVECQWESSSVESLLFHFYCPLWVGKKGKKKAKSVLVRCDQFDEQKNEQEGQVMYRYRTSAKISIELQDNVRLWLEVLPHFAGLPVNVELRDKYDD